MSMRRRSRLRRDGAKANIDMNSLIDLTFLLLVVFIVTLPTLEQTVKIVLPTGKTSAQKDEKQKNVSISIDKDGKVYLGDVPVTREDLKASLAKSVEAEPETNVLIRGDVDSDYGDVYAIVKIAKDCNVKHLGLVSKEK